MRRRGDNTVAQTKHVGLAAVARLGDALGLSRPTILRIGGVPTSTFYAWQKSPHTALRTPTVTRLLRLQAQVAILDEALGRDRMRAWVLEADRLDKLQGDEAEFAQVLAEARTALAEATRIRPRPRMCRADYATGPGDAANELSDRGWTPHRLEDHLSQAFARHPGGIPSHLVRAARLRRRLPAHRDRHLQRTLRVSVHMAHRRTTQRTRGMLRQPACCPPGVSPSPTYAPLVRRERTR
jgi:hypothetical protein